MKRGRDGIESAINEYESEIRKRHPNVTFVRMSERFSSEDAWIRIRVPSSKDVSAVLDTAISLQYDWYVNRGVYIFVTVSAMGPLAVRS